MIIYDKTGGILFDVQVDDSSVRNRSIMGDNSVTLYLSLPEYTVIPVGSYIEYQGQRYTLWRPDNFKKHGTRNYQYTITFGSNQEILKRYKYKSLSDIPFQLKFSLTAKPKMFLQLLVDNMNLRDTGWAIGDCIDATEKYLSFSHEYCYDVLGRLASEFNTEWEIEGKTIHLRKVEKFKTEPLALSYGKGNGFRPGVGRANQGDKSPVSLLFVQGGDRNIDLATYNSRYLLLPKSKELEYEGRRYKTDKDGMYITRADKEVAQYNEDSFDASNIYPSRVGEVTAVTTEDGKDDEGNPVTFYNIVDTTIPADLNYRDCRIPNEKATIIFQTGVLTGREFDIVQTDKDLTGYDHATRTFELVSLEEDGVTLPNENLKPDIGDKYAVFNIKLPQAYIQDDATKTGASWEMFKEAVRYFYENEEEQFSFTGELDPIWAKNKWLEIGGKITPGAYILFSDTQFQPEGILIRITSVKDYINKPHAPVIELSNVPVGGSLSSELGKIDSNEVVDENRYKDSISLTKRRFRDLEETGKMLEAAIDGFSGAINPIYIQTMSLQVGSESLQFRFVNSKTSPSEIIPNFAYNQSTKVFTAPSTILQHMTLGISKISPTHQASEYKFWTMSSYTSPSLDVTDAMYFYAKCSKSGTTGSFILSKTAYKMDPGDGYYYFLVGTLSSEYEGERSYVNVYGFTEVLPGRITTNVISSSDGNTYFNLTEGKIVAANLTILAGSGYNNLTDKPDLSKYATTQWTQNSITNTVADLNLGQYATTEWTKDRITNSVKGLASESYVNQTASSLSISISNVDSKANTAKNTADSANSTANTAQSTANSSKLITDAFYKFSNESMQLNRRIEVGPVSIAGFDAQGGISPNTNNVAFWAGGNYSQATTGAAKTVLRHDGSGHLANKSIQWDTAGNTKFQSNDSGDKIILNPSNRSFQMINSSGKTVSEMSFQNIAGYQSSFKLQAFLYSTEGSTLYITEVTPNGFMIYDSSGNSFRGFNSGLFLMKNLPTIDPRNSGAIWRDGTTLKISLG